MTQLHRRVHRVVIVQRGHVVTNRVDEIVKVVRFVFAVGVIGTE